RGSGAAHADRSQQPFLDAWARRLRTRVLDHDDLRRAAADPAAFHGVGCADRTRARLGGSVRAGALAGDRPVERLVSHAARTPTSVHARSARPTRLLPAADAVHAEPLADDRDRPRILLRVLRVRAAVPWPLSRSAAPQHVRPRT